MKTEPCYPHRCSHTPTSQYCLHAAHTALCERVIRRNDAQSHHIPPLSSHIKNLPSQRHSSPNSHGHLSNPMLRIWTAGPFKVSPSWQGKCFFFKLGERGEVFLSIHITEVDLTWSALLFCGSNLCQVATYSAFWGFCWWVVFSPISKQAAKKIKSRLLIWNFLRKSGKWNKDIWANYILL